MSTDRPDSVTVTECPECGEPCLVVLDWGSPRYEVESHCNACGCEWTDGYADLYGCMSVPWGFML